jgi:ABC-type nickel/cobalt efflux system permease component RcnA
MKLLLKQKDDLLFVGLIVATFIAGTVIIIYDTLLHSHRHAHTHVITHTHDGTTHTHVIEHTHEHNHVISENKHGHTHSIDELELYLKHEMV